MIAACCALRSPINRRLVRPHPIYIAASVGYRIERFDIKILGSISKHRKLRVYQNIERVSPSISWHPRVFLCRYVLKQSFYVYTVYKISKSYISTSLSVIDIISNSIPISISKTMYRYHTYLGPRRDTGFISTMVVNYCTLDGNVKAVSY